MPNPLEAVQTHLDNTLDPSAAQRGSFAGIFGERPSVSAKSPYLWNAAFKGLEMDSIFLPFDVTDENLPALVDALRDTPAYLGGSVTVPYKARIMPLLDELDIKAQQIGAVNTVARTDDGRLIGYNTDAQGAIDSLKKAMPWQQQPFLPGLTGLKVLLIGAGGAGRAVAFAVAEEIGEGGLLTVANRTAGVGAELAESVNQAYGNTQGISEADVDSVLPEVDLIINASLRGQSGMRTMAEGQITCLEPYSALAPANPAMVDGLQYPDDSAVKRAWYQASLDDISQNQSRSARAIITSKTGVLFFDIIFSPLETTLLSQGRLAGHPTLNGKGMNLAQAVDGFVNRVMKANMLERGWNIDQVYGKTVELMAQEW